MEKPLPVFRVTVEIDIVAPSFGKAQDALTQGMTDWFNNAEDFNGDRKHVDDPKRVVPQYFLTRNIERLGPNDGE